MEGRNVNSADIKSTIAQITIGRYILLSALAISIFSFTTHSLISTILAAVFLPSIADMNLLTSDEMLGMIQSQNIVTTVAGVVAKIIVITFALWIFSRRFPIFTKQSLSIKSGDRSSILYGILLTTLLTMTFNLIPLFFGTFIIGEVGIATTIVYGVPAFILGFAASATKVVILAYVYLKTRSLLASLALFVTLYIIDSLLEEINTRVSESSVLYWIICLIAASIFIPAIIKVFRYILNTDEPHNKIRE